MNIASMHAMRLLMHLGLIVYCFILLLFILATSLVDGGELLLGDGPDGSWRSSVAGNGGSDDFTENTDRRSLLVVVPNLVGPDFEDGHSGVFRSTSVDSVSLVSEPCLDHWAVELGNSVGVGHSPLIVSCYLR
jgi:hypothetical protein